MSAESIGAHHGLARERGRLARVLRRAATAYLVGAICVALCTVMLAAARAVGRSPRSRRPREAAAAAADLLPARAQPRQLQPAVGLPGRACRPTSATASARRC